MKENFLLYHRDDECIDNSVFSYEEFPIPDIEYFELMKQVNGGAFFMKALFIYPFIMEERYPSVLLVNKKMNILYDQLFLNLFTFGQDIFGNQFCFDKENYSVILFNIEDGERVVLANNFTEWLSVLENDYDYLTGFSYSKKWQNSNILGVDQRLCPKIPFVIGGKYEESNFYASVFPSYLELNADIARQIYDLPDGTAVTYQIRPPENET
jgi:hypothetical protein